MDHKNKILVVDDRHDIVEYLQTLLGLSGFEIITAFDGETAVLEARAKKPDLILLDIMMPKLNGIETCILIKKDPATQHIPIVMLTALNQMNDIEKAFAAGAVDYVTKPFDAQRLIQKAKKILGE